MPDPVTGLVVGGTALLSGSMQADAASEAASIQGDASAAGIAEQRAARLAMEKLLSPYVSAGTTALGQQQALLGLSGANAQKNAYAAIENSAGFQAQVQQGENAMLQNASATGGLRGGNIQGALAQYRPAMLTNAINQQYANLGGLTQMGQNSAAGVGSSGMTSANNVASLLAQQGAASAGGVLGQANAYSGLLNAPMQLLGMQAGAGGMKIF
jgi:hypothetical protein